MTTHPDKEHERHDPKPKAAARVAADEHLAPNAPHAPDRQQQAEQERLRKEGEAAQQRQNQKAREFSDKMFEAQQQRAIDERKEAQARRELAEKHAEDRKKEVARRAAMSPAERMEEDEKRAERTPEEIAKENEEKGIVGFVSPEQMDQINQLAGTPSYPLFNETAHPTEMVLSEANGQRSRAYAYLADPVTIKVGQPLKQTVAPTSTTPGTFVPAAVGADCTAIALYGGTSNPTNGLRIAVLVRDCEVNGYCINWGAITVPEQAIGLTTLATAGIIVRY